MLGLALELFHGFKVRMYLDVSNETRRLMWTLAHAHGSLLGLIHVVLGLSLHSIPELGTRTIGILSSSLIGASILLPGGFFLGGISVYSGDPGLGILAVPVGSALLMITVFLIARASAGSEASRGPARTSSSGKQSK